METETLAIFIPLTFTIATAIVVYLYLSNRSKERLALIEKSSSHEDLKLLFAKRKASDPSVYRVAKWGILLVSVGLAIILGIILQPYMAEEITFGLVVLFPGIGLLVYYSLFKNSLNQHSEQE